MKPGRELDARVAVDVMGWPSPSEPGLDQKEYEKRRYALTLSVPNYSTDIAAAWPVLSRIQALEPGTVIEMKSYSPEHFGIRIIGRNIIYEESRTAPHAICLAALRAVGAGVD